MLRKAFKCRGVQFLICPCTCRRSQARAENEWINYANKNVKHVPNATAHLNFKEITRWKILTESAFPISVWFLFGGLWMRWLKLRQKNLRMYFDFLWLSSSLLSFRDVQTSLNCSAEVNSINPDGDSAEISQVIVGKSRTNQTLIHSIPWIIWKSVQDVYSSLNCSCTLLYPDVSWWTAFHKISQQATQTHFSSKTFDKKKLVRFEMLKHNWKKRHFVFVNVLKYTCVCSASSLHSFMRLLIRASEI